jgi:raffinose/stachyose/melibiose transport system permease protein
MTSEGLPDVRSRAVGSEPITQSKVRQRARLQGNAPPWMFAAPAVLLLVLFQFAANVAGGYYAFTNWNGISHAAWIGLANFRQILADPAEISAVWHTLELGVAFIVSVNVIGLAVALALHRGVKTRLFLRSVFFVPLVINPLAASYIWQFILQDQGALNTVLGDVGLGSLRHPWLADPSSALWMVLLVLLWQYTGLSMMIYLAGLQRIPDELREAALIDGASAWAYFRRVIIPLLAPALTIGITLTSILGLRVFDQVIALTNGGPVSASETLATQVYKNTFVLGGYGYGAAIALSMTVLIGAVVLAALWGLRRVERRMS